VGAEGKRKIEIRKGTMTRAGESRDEIVGVHSAHRGEEVF
jgi:hypothetical protein